MGPTRVYEFTPALDTNIYASGDRLGPASTKITSVVQESGFAQLIGVDILDKAKQSAAIDILFFSGVPTVASADNAAFDVTDANMVLDWASVFTIAATDYKTISASTIASIRDVHILKAKKSSRNPDGKSLWFSLVSRGTPTYAASDLFIRFYFSL